jgi:hypothetical protein
MQRFSVDGQQVTGTLPPEYAMWGGSITYFWVANNPDLHGVSGPPAPAGPNWAHKGIQPRLSRST